jgi:hypothetical protein
MVTPLLMDIAKTGMNTAADSCARIPQGKYDVSFVDAFEVLPCFACVLFFLTALTYLYVRLLCTSSIVLQMALYERMLIVFLGINTHTHTYICIYIYIYI